MSKQQPTPLTRSRRAEMARAIMDHQREAYAASGDEGDFEDGERYLRDDAADWELLDLYVKYGLE